MIRGTEQTLLPSVQMANKYVKRWSTSLAIREMQIKTTVGHHLPPVRVAVINKTSDDSCGRGCGEKETLICYQWECKLTQPLWKTVRRFLRKLRMQFPCDPATPFLGIYHPPQKKTQNRKYLQRYIPSYIHWSIIHGGQNMETTEMFLNRWLNKKGAVRIYNGTRLSHKKNEILPFMTTWMDLENIMLSEISQTEKVKKHMISLICGI